MYTELSLETEIPVYTELSLRGLEQRDSSVYRAVLEQRDSIVLTASVSLWSLTESSNFFFLFESLESKSVTSCFIFPMSGWTVL